MEPPITCPICQFQVENEAQLITEDYFTIKCQNCNAIIHFNVLGIQCYFIKTIYNNKHYDLCFYMDPYIVGRKFTLNFLDTDPEKYAQPRKWITLMTLPFLPKITFNNLQDKLKLMLVWM
jgi:hypothetical protein